MISGFALYPAGSLGTGLLLLRLSVAASLALLAEPAANWAQFLGILAAAGLCAGLWTRVLGCFALAVPIILLANGGTVSLAFAIHAIDALALILTGPGAWSIDAALFGRRTIV